MDDVAAELRQLRRRLDGVERRLDDDTRHAELDRRLHEATRAMDDVRRELTRRVENAEARTDRQGEKLHTALVGAVADLTARIHGLSRQVRRLSGDDPARLDPTPEVVALAERAERGRRCRNAALGPDARAAATQAVAAWSAWQEQRCAQVAEVLDAVRVIAATAPSDPQRDGAVPRYRAARAALATLEDGRASTERAAARAREELARDEASAGRFAAEIRDGDEAAAALTGRLEALLIEVADRGEMLPGWFEDAAGPPPSPGRAGWLGFGVDLLGYRATYGVTTTVTALGPPPGPDAPAERHAWHRRLAAQLRG